MESLTAFMGIGHISIPLPVAKARRRAERGVVGAEKRDVATVGRVCRRGSSGDNEGS